MQLERISNLSWVKVVIIALNSTVYFKIYLSASSREACASRNHFFLSLDFHELWFRVMSICLFTEVKQQWASLVLGWVTTSVHYFYSDGFAARASRLKPLSTLLFSKAQCPYL